MRVTVRTEIDLGAPVPDSDVVTAADIARLAGVTRATVSNWRRRHADFPDPSGGTAASPAYSRTEVERWLAGRGALPEMSFEEKLWRDVRAATPAEIASTDLAVHAAHLLFEADIPDLKLAIETEDAELAAVLARHARQRGRQQVLEALVGRYVESSGARAAATPEPVAELMTALAGISKGEVVFDPAVGTGDLLFAARKHDVSRLLGQDIDITAAALVARLLTDPDVAAKVELRDGDSLRADRFPDVQADVVLCHPPFGMQDWGLDELAGDPRWEYGTPARSESELAWVQHSLAHLRPGGRAMVLLPPAVASRPAGRRVRTELVRHGALRGIVSLPPGAVEPRNIPVHIWVLERPVGQGRRDPQLLFVEGAYLGGEWPSTTEQIVGIWFAHYNDAAESEGQPGFWRKIPAVDVLDDEVDVTPARHVGVHAEAWSPQRTSTELTALRSELNRTLENYEALLPREGWEVARQGPHWRTADISDLSHWRAVTFFRASAAAPAGQEPAPGLDLSAIRTVLRQTDIAAGQPPTGAVPDGPAQHGWVVVQVGDVIVPAIAPGHAGARVASEEDHGAVLGRGLHLIRPDPGRLDPWFLAGFLGNTANRRQAGTGTSSRIDVRRLTIPIIPLDDQRRYGAAFRRLHELDKASGELAMITARLSRLLSDNLAAGRLEPHTEPPETEQNAAQDPLGMKGGGKA